jgi:REP element-mobilizing transposase RayT
MGCDRGLNLSFGHHYPPLIGDSQSRYYRKGDNLTQQYNPAIHHRRSIRLQGYNYGQAGLYFITICAWQRQHIFGSIQAGEMQLSSFGEIARDEWLRTSQLRSNIELAEFVVMPNHLHGIIAIVERSDWGTRRRAPTGISAEQINQEAAQSVRGTPPRAPTEISAEQINQEATQSVRGTPPRAPTEISAEQINQEATQSGWSTPPRAPTEAFGKPTSNTIPTIVRGYKAAVTKQINILRNSPQCPVWQRNYYEHIIRSEANYLRIAAYILDNPRRWDQDSLNKGKGGKS